MKIDLNTCKPGQKLKLRDSTTAVYDGKSKNEEYPHSIVINGYHYYMTSEGYYFNDHRTNSLDVVEIISSEEPEGNIVIKHDLYIKTDLIYQLYEVDGKYRWYNHNNPFNCLVFTSIARAISFALSHQAKLVERKIVQKTIEEVTYIEV